MFAKFVALDGRELVQMEFIFTVNLTGFFAVRGVELRRFWAWYDMSVLAHKGGKAQPLSSFKASERQKPPEAQPFMRSVNQTVEF